MTPREARVCVIGAGAIGLASAVCLARRGLTDVVVLEATHVAAGSSGLSVGIIETQYLEPLDIELRVRSMQFFEELERNHGLPIVRNGYLRLARGEEALRAAERSVQVQHELGAADARVLDRDGIEALIPDLRCDDVAGGLFGPSDGFLDGHLYCGLLAEWATELGVELQIGQRVTGAELGSERRHRLLTERGFEVACDLVVNAAGPWAQRVAEIAGGTMSLIPQRQQATVVSISRQLDYVMPSVMDYTPRSGEIGLYFRHERPDRLIAGLHSEEAGGGVSDPDDYPRSPDQDFLEVVAEKLLHRLPGFPDAGLGGGWAGLYPVSIDGLPQVGPNPGLETVVNAGAAGGSGIQLSPVIGELVADWIIDGRPSAVSDAERLLPGRPRTMAGPNADKEAEQ